jgi:hypothetical protein
MCVLSRITYSANVLMVLGNVFIKCDRHVMLTNNVRFSQCFNSVPLVFYMFGTSYVRHQEHLTVHSALLYTQPYCTLSLTVHSALLYTQPYCTLSLTVHSALLYTQSYCTLSLTVHSALPD